MKCALVTGGSRGIGRAICIKMAQMGFYVLVNYKGNETEASNTLAMVIAAGGGGEVMQFDVADRQQVQQVLGGWVEKNADREIEVLVNNAGIKDDGLMMWMKDEQWDRVVQTSLGGFFYVTRIILNSMLLKRYGRIINIISTSVKIPLKNLGVSNTIRAAVAGWAKTMANELGQYNITVNSVLPGFTRTQRLDTIIRDAARTKSKTPQDIEKEMQEETPMKRFGEPSEIAAMVAFLASPAASYVNGTSIPVDGGRTGSI